MSKTASTAAYREKNQLILQLINLCEGRKNKRGKERNAIWNQQNNEPALSVQQLFILCQTFAFKNYESHPSLSPPPTWCGLRCLLPRHKLMKRNPFCNNNTIQSTWETVFAGLQFSWELRTYALEAVIFLLNGEKNIFTFPSFSSKSFKAYWLFSGVYFHFRRL